jgi:hypothetical protein
VRTHGEAVLAVACSFHDEAGRLQTGRQPPGDIVIVLDQQDANGATPQLVSGI